MISISDGWVGWYSVGTGLSVGGKNTIDSLFGKVMIKEMLI
jgi:hypothetical protein